MRFHSSTSFPLRAEPARSAKCPSCKNRPHPAWDLPRCIDPLQVQQCLPELLRLCRADRGLPAGAVVGGSSGAVKLSVNLEVVDEAGRTWVLLLKTWQNVVGREHRPTFVLENTGEWAGQAGGFERGECVGEERGGRSGKSTLPCLRKFTKEAMAAGSRIMTGSQGRSQQGILAP